jgi:hypothetical protein
VDGPWAPARTSVQRLQALMSPYAKASRGASALGAGAALAPMATRPRQGLDDDAARPGRQRDTSPRLEGDQPCTVILD